MKHIWSLYQAFFTLQALKAIILLHIQVFTIHPVFVLFHGKHRDEPNPGLLVRKNPYYPYPALDLLIESLQHLARTHTVTVMFW